ncbi:MAG: carboxypeptidase-like regulatory domain-containing protein [Candidatus Sulfotelmatobacter sp.]
MRDVKHSIVRTALTYSLRSWVCLMGLCLTVAGARQQAQAQEAAQVSDSSADSKPVDNTLSVTGTVVNSLTGEPVRGAVVAITTGQINGQTGSSTLSDNSGHFQFDGLTEGRAFISAIKPGFGNQLRGQLERISVQITRNVSPVLLKMDPSGAIFGRLTGSDEQPLEGFFLHVISKRRVGGKQQWVPFPSQTTTDDNGNFRIAGLPADTYYLQVAQNQQTTLSRRGVPNPREQSYAGVFYPGVADFNSATPIELTGGREVEANFSVAAEPLYEVSGVVSAQENLNSPVEFSRKAGDGSDFTQNAMVQDGRFQIKLPAGSFSVTGSTATGIQLAASGVVVSSDNANLDVTLRLASRIRVELQTEGSSGGTQRNTLEQPGSIGMNLQLVRTGGAPGASYWWAPGQSDGFQGVAPGVYTVQANGPSGTWYIKSLHSGDLDLLSDDLTVVEGPQPQPIEVTLRDDPASVRGNVTPADDLAPAIVLLVQPHGTRNLIKVSGAFQGKFEIDGVAPGDYFLLAIDGMDRVEYENPEVLNPYLSKAQHVSLQPHGMANVTLSLSPSGR